MTNFGFTDRVIEALTAAWGAGMTREQLLQRAKGCEGRTLNMILSRLKADQRIFARGSKGAGRLYFHANVPLKVSDAAADALAARIRIMQRDARRARNARFRLTPEDGAEAKRIAAEAKAKAQAEREAAQRAAKADRQEKLRAAREAKALAKAARVPKVPNGMKDKTARMNTLADQYRGTASPKEPAKTAPKVTGMETARKVVGPSCRSRYEVDPQSLSGLSKLPFGVYAEPASRWASVATDRRAA